MSDFLLVKELRERTNAPLGKCVQAIKDTAGDIEKAIELLKVRGVIAAGNISIRTATEGAIVTYVHGGKIGVMLEVNCETDFVARSIEFLQFVDDLTLHIAAVRPQYASPSDVSSQTHEDQRKIFREQLREQKKPEQSWSKIIEGKLGAWLKEVCLSEQESVVHAKKTIEQLRTELVAKCGENVRVRRFVVWELGEGLTKAVKEDLATEIFRLTNV